MAITRLSNKIGAICRVTSPKEEDVLEQLRKVSQYQQHADSVQSTRQVNVLPCFMYELNSNLLCNLI